MQAHADDLLHEIRLVGGQVRNGSAPRFAGVLVVLSLSALSSPLHAQATSPAASRPTSVATVSVFATVAAEARSNAPDANPRAPSSALVESDAKDLAEYIKWQRQFARESWNWHLSSTKLLMYVVLAIVFFGLFITYLQFTRDDPRGRKRRRVRRVSQAEGVASEQAEEAEEAVDVSASKLKVGLDGFEMSSQIIGLLVLGFSLAFFYLYVKVVYPMQEVDLQTQAHSAAQSAPDTTAGK